MDRCLLYESDSARAREGGEVGAPENVRRYGRKSGMQIGPQLKGLLRFRIRGFEVVDDSESIFDAFRVFASWGVSFTANLQNSKAMRMNIEVNIYL